MSVGHSPPASRRRRSGAIVLVAALAAVVGLTLAAQPASAGPACPTEGLPFTSRLTNGKVKIGKMEPATGATATACGVVVFTPDLDLEATVPQASLTFGPLDVEFGPFHVPVELKAVSDFTGPAAADPTGLHIKLTGEVMATTKVLGSTCTIGPFTTTLTTGESGSLTGVPFSGPDPANMTGRLVGNEGGVPGANFSLHCLIAPILNGIIGLPSPPGESTVEFDASLVLTPAAMRELKAAE